MKSVFIIAIVAVAMIGMMVMPSAYSEVPPPIETFKSFSCDRYEFNSQMFFMAPDDSILIPNRGSTDTCKISPDGTISHITVGDDHIAGYNLRYVDDAGNLFFVGGNGNLGLEILKTNPNGFILFEFQPTTDLGLPFNSIAHITIDNNGNIYVQQYGSPTNEKTVKFSSGGTRLNDVVFPDNVLYDSMRLKFDSDGNQYYFSGDNDIVNVKLHKVNPNGDVVTLIDSDELSCSGDLEIDQTGNIYISCPTHLTSGNGMAKKYDPNGNLLFTFNSTPLSEYQGINNIEIDSMGRIHANTYNMYQDQIVVFRDKFVEDNVPPVITPIDDIIIETTSSTGSPATFSTNAIDAIDGVMDVTCSPESGTVFPLGTTIPVTCISEDYSYNSSFVTFNVNIVNPPPPTISPTSPPTDSNTTVEGNNLDSKIFATGTVQNLIDVITTVSTTWKDPGGVTVYQSDLQLDASGNFNNEFDNPMYVRDMRDSGLYTTTVTYDDVTTQYTWNYVSTVYAAQQAAAQAVIDAAAAEAAAAQAAADAAAAQAAAQQAAADAAAAEAAAAAQAAINLASQPVSTNTITTVDESGFSQSCVDTGCYTPLTTVVNYGDTVTMTNTDPTGVHTFTSGTVNGFSPTPSGTFDTGVLMSGDSFQWQVDVSGEVPYYCMLHTWMVGTIVVQGSGAEEAAAQAVIDAANAAAAQAVIDAANAAAAQAAAAQAVIDAANAAAAQAAAQAAADAAAQAVIDAVDAAAAQAAAQAVIDAAAAQAAAQAAADAAAAALESTSLIDLDILMSKTTYDLGDLVGFSISGNDFSGTQNVSVDVTDPTGNTVISRSINISPNTSGEIEFRLSENFKTGTYKITTTTSDNGQIISETSDFKLQSQFNSFTISGLTVSDQQGNSSILQAGEMGFIKVNLSSTKSIATLVTVNLFDAELTSIGIGSVQTTLASGESEIILSFMIPDNAAIGSADIYVNAFSDWPSNGGTALTGELASMEDIS